MKIAIVGAGVSGLVAAHLLAPEHEVTVFEAGDYPGGHTNTVRVDTADETHWVDTGFIVFNDRNYPRFEKLLNRLGVASQPSNMSFGVTDQHGDFEYASTSANGLFAKRAHLATPWFHRMLADMFRFQREARALLTSDGHGPSLGEFLDQQRYSRRVRGPADRAPGRSGVVGRPSPDVELPRSLPGRVLRQPRDARASRPAEVADRPGRLAPLRAQADRALRLRLRTPIDGIVRSDDHVAITPRGGDPERFDHVVIATHSDQALDVLEDATHREHELLGSIPYQPNEAVLHTDRTLLPRRRRAWASWNYHLLDEPTGKPTVTYHMNRLQTLKAEREFCVTLNHGHAIAPDKVIRTIPYAHPVYTAAGEAAQRRHHEISGLHTRTHFAGAYWGWGFHEDGVKSGERVALDLGAKPL